MVFLWFSDPMVFPCWWYPHPTRIPIHGESTVTFPTFVKSPVLITDQLIWLVVTGTWLDYFPFQICDVILPIDELTFFKMVTTNPVIIPIELSDLLWLKFLLKPIKSLLKPIKSLLKPIKSAEMWGPQKLCAVRCFSMSVLDPMDPMDRSHHPNGKDV